MTPPYRYRRGVGRALQKQPAGDRPPKAGEMIALPGTKHRTYRAPVTLDANNKPVRTPLIEVGRKIRRPPEQADWITIFGDVVKARD